MKVDAAAFATSLLNALLLELDEDPTFRTPTRTYVAGGDPAFECEELVVHGVRIFAAASEFGPGVRTRDDVVFTFECGVTVARCAFPDDASPTASQLNSLGITSVNDGAALLRAGLAAHQNGRLGGYCTDVSIGPVIWATPAGGLAGVTLTVTAQL